MSRIQVPVLEEKEFERLLYALGVATGALLKANRDSQLARCLIELTAKVQDGSAVVNE